MDSNFRRTGKTLAKRWGVNVKYSLYRETGDWYHQLKRFPGALFDANGYVIFETEESFRTCPQLRIKQDVNIPDGITSIPGYVLVRVDGVEDISKTKNYHSYERAVGNTQEGAVHEVLMTRYERDPRARKACILHYGTKCFVCDMSFEQKYGSIGIGFIHIHHLKPLSQFGGPIDIDPIKDLRPVCPNCHAMLHKGDPVFSIEELKNIISKSSQTSASN